MSDLSPSAYLPIGTLHVDKENSNLSPELLEFPLFKSWSFFIHPRDEPPVTTDDDRLKAEAQRCLLTSDTLKPCRTLFSNRWIRLEYKICDTRCTVRVYFLPDDVHRAHLDRSSLSHRQARQSIIARLDKSNDAWHGHQSRVTPDSLEPGLDREPPSLLHLFNTIPSPTPKAEDVSDPSSRDA